MLIPPDNELPYRLRESTFRIYEPLIAKAIRDAPTPVMVNPAPLRCTTYAARLRDAISAFKRFQWPSSFSLFELTTASLNVRHNEATVYLGPKGARKVPNEFRFINPDRVAGLPIDVELDNVSLVAFCHLLSQRLLAGPIILRTQVLSQEVINSLEERFDIAIEISTDNSTVII